jgi:DnaJ family protein A protein 2
MPTHYELLGINRNATIDEIRKAYRTKAKKCHPDKGGSPEDFKHINSAYNVLVDQNQRSLYDAKTMYVYDMFENLPSWVHAHDNDHQKDVVIVLTIEEICLGVQKFETICTRVLDKTKLISCNACNGTGVRTITTNIDEFSRTQHTQCTKCVEGYLQSSMHYKSQNEQISVVVPPGSPDGTHLYLPDMKNEVVIRYPRETDARGFSVQPHTLDIIYQLHASLLDALHGFSHSIYHPDGNMIRISQQQPLSPGIYVIMGRGIHSRDYNRTGNFIVKFSVEDMSDETRLLGKYDPHVDQDCTLQKRFVQPTTTHDIFPMNSKQTSCMQM